MPKTKNSSSSKPNHKLVKSTPVPASVSRTVLKTAPKMTSGPKGACHIVHTELVNLLNSPPPVYTCQSLRINPGLDDVFHWLAPIANRFEFYQFSKLSFEYVGKSPYSTVGSFAMAFDFDCEDPSPSTAISFGAQDPQKSGNPFSSFNLDLPVSQLRALGPKLSRMTLTPGTDSRLYDLGNLQIAYYGGVEGSYWGDLYVHYDIVLTRPQTTDTTQSLVLTSVPTTITGLPATLPATLGVASQQAKSLLSLVNKTTTVSNEFVKLAGNLELVGKMIPSIVGSKAYPAPRATPFDTEYVLEFPHDFTGIVRYCSVIEITTTNATTIGFPGIHGLWNDRPVIAWPSTTGSSALVQGLDYYERIATPLLTTSSGWVIQPFYAMIEDGGVLYEPIGGYDIEHFNWDFDYAAWKRGYALQGESLFLDVEFTVLVTAKLGETLRLLMTFSNLIADHFNLSSISWPGMKFGIPQVTLTPTSNIIVQPFLEPVLPDQVLEGKATDLSEVSPPSGKAKSPSRRSSH